MEIVICLLEEAVRQYRAGNYLIGDQCLYMAEMIRTGSISFADPLGEFAKRE